MDLSQLRQQIDTIDRQIVDLYEKRMDVSRQVAEYKIETGKKVFDKQREQEKIGKANNILVQSFWFYNRLGSLYRHHRRKAEMHKMV